MKKIVRFLLVLNSKKFIIYFGCRCLLYLSYLGWCIGFMIIKGNFLCNEVKNMLEDWRSCESFVEIFYFSFCLIF